MEKLQQALDSIQKHVTIDHIAYNPETCKVWMYHSWSNPLATPEVDVEAVTLEEALDFAKKNKLSIEID